MRRIDTSRWVRILAWTGASLAWGATITAIGLEPLRTESRAPTVPVVEELERPAVMPRPTWTGLVILRHGRDRSFRAERADTASPPMSTAPAPRSSGS